MSLAPRKWLSRKGNPGATARVLRVRNRRPRRDRDETPGGHDEGRRDTEGTTPQAHACAGGIPREQPRRPTRAPVGYRGNNPAGPRVRRWDTGGTTPQAHACAGGIPREQPRRPMGGPEGYRGETPWGPGAGSRDARAGSPRVATSARGIPRDDPLSGRWGSVQPKLERRGPISIPQPARYRPSRYAFTALTIPSANRCW